MQKRPGAGRGPECQALHALGEAVEDGAPPTHGIGSGAVRALRRLGAVAETDAEMWLVGGSATRAPVVAMSVSRLSTVSTCLARARRSWPTVDDEHRCRSPQTRCRCGLAPTWPRALVIMSMPRAANDPISVIDDMAHRGQQTVHPSGVETRDTTEPVRQDRRPARQMRALAATQ